MSDQLEQNKMNAQAFYDLMFKMWNIGMFFKSSQTRRQTRTQCSREVSLKLPLMAEPRHSGTSCTSKSGLVTGKPGCLAHKKTETLWASVCGVVAV